MTLQFFKKAAIWLATFVTLAIVIVMIAAVFQSEDFQSHRSTSTIVWAGLLSLAVITGAGVLAYYVRRRNNLFIFTLIMGLTALKLIVLVKFPLSPTSDYFNYHSFAQNLVAGLTWHKMETTGLLGDNMLWPHVINISWFFSVFYSFFFSNIVVGQLVSITLSGVSAFLIHVLVKKILVKPVAVFAALVFQAIPAYWLYSVINAPESFFLVFLLGTVICYYDALYTVNDTFTRNYFFLGLSLLLLFLANMVRPVGIIWVIVIVLFAIFGLSNRRRPFKHLLAMTAIFAVTFSILSAAAVPIYRVFYGVDWAPAAVLQNYSLATGTSVTTGGAYNAQVRNETDTLFNQKHVPLDERYTRITQRMSQITRTNLKAIERTGVTAFLWHKTKNYMDENYGADWLFYNINGKSKASKEFAKNTLPFASVYAVIYFGLFLGLTALAIVAQLLLMFKKRALSNRRINLMFYSALALDGFFLSAMLPEVQGRYHIILYLPLVVLLALGAQLFSRTNRKEFTI